MLFLVLSILYITTESRLSSDKLFFPFSKYIFINLLYGVILIVFRCYYEKCKLEYDTENEVHKNAKS